MLDESRKQNFPDLIPSTYSASTVRQLTINPEEDRREVIEEQSIKIDEEYILNDEDIIDHDAAPVLPRPRKYRGNNTPEKFQKMFLVFRGIHRRRPPGYVWKFKRVPIENMTE